jgi:hypothetical protein
VKREEGGKKGGAMEKWKLSQKDENMEKKGREHKGHESCTSFLYPSQVNIHSHPFDTTEKVFLDKLRNKHIKLLFKCKCNH